MSVRTQETPSKRIPPDYADIIRPFSDEQRQQLAEVKRFFECYEGDKDLRDNLKAGTVTPEQRALLKEIGITFEIEELEPVWRDKELFDEALSAPESQAAMDAVKLVESYPLLNLWAQYKLRRVQAYIEQRTWLTSTPNDSPRYHAWRMRRIAATKSELGNYGYEIDHPALAIEMQVGCSVGCYFCAFDAGKLQKVFDYDVPENRQLFREVATSLRMRLGWSSGHALLYWSTEPADNPHYIQFMKDYREITGSSVCTATARADEKWVTDLLAHYGPMNQPWPRISVLTRSIMYKLHKRFTPWEAKDMVLLMQQKDGEEARLKVPGGRDKMLKRLDEYTDLRDLDTARKPEDIVVPQGSIACVSGFLINLLEKTIKLISPCYTTKQHRYGYRVFDSVTFTDGADFDRQLVNMIERKCLLEPYDEMVMKFRDDLRYREREGGFQVTTRHQVHACVDNEIYGPLGDLLNRGTLTYAQLVEELVETHGFNVMLVAAAIKSLFDQGFLCELDVIAPGMGAPDTVLQLAH